MNELLEEMFTSALSDPYDPLQKVAHRYVRAAISKNIKRSIKYIPFEEVEQRRQAISKYSDSVEHIYSWIFSSIQADNLFQTEPNNPRAEHLPWLHDLGQNNIPKKLNHGTIESLYDEAQIWSKSRQAKVNLEDLTENTTTVMDYGDGFKMVQLHRTDDLCREGKLMGHCVGDGTYDNEVENGKLIVYSLRDPENNPHCTIGVRDKYIEQCMGKNNAPVVDKYRSYIQKFFEENSDLNHGTYVDVAYTGMVEVVHSRLPQDNLVAIDKIPPNSTTNHLDLSDAFWVKKMPDNLKAYSVTLGRDNKNALGKYSEELLASLCDIENLYIHNYPDIEADDILEEIEYIRFSGDKKPDFSHWFDHWDLGQTSNFTELTRKNQATIHKSKRHSFKL